MEFSIELNIHEDRYYLYEYVGSEPCTWECIAQFCWRDCVPCNFCEAGRKKVPDEKVWQEWKAKYDKKKVIPCSKKHSKYFQNHRLDDEPFTHNQFAVVNGEAVPIQTTIEF